MKTLAPLMLCLLFSVALQATPTTLTILTNSAGQVIGANHMMIEGVEYNLRLKEGTCAEVFGVCAPENFTFRDWDLGLAAGRASVGVLPQEFTYRPEKIFGCHDLPVDHSHFNTCAVMTPWAVDAHSVLTWGALFYQGDIDENGEFYGFVSEPDHNENPGLGVDTSQAPGLVWAVWTPAAATVPEAKTSLLLILGSGLLVLVRRVSCMPRSRSCEGGRNPLPRTTAAPNHRNARQSAREKQ
jgi:hypothetical protein